MTPAKLHHIVAACVSQLILQNSASYLQVLAFGLQMQNYPDIVSCILFISLFHICVVFEALKSIAVFDTHASLPRRQSPPFSLDQTLHPRRPPLAFAVLPHNLCNVDYGFPDQSRSQLSISSVHNFLLASLQFDVSFL
jgi:hypothetical protein